MDIKKSILCILVSMCIVVSCFNGISASADTGKISRLCDYFDSLGIQNGVIFDFNDLHDLGYFDSNSGIQNYSNFLDYCTKYGCTSFILFGYYNLDYVDKGYVVKGLLYVGIPNNCRITYSDSKVTVLGSTNTTYCPRFRVSYRYYKDGSKIPSLNSTSCGATKLEVSQNDYLCYQVSGNYTDGDTVEDLTTLQSSLNEKKKTDGGFLTGIKKGLSDFLKGTFDFDLFSPSLIDKFSLLENSFNGWFSPTLSGALGIDVEVGDDTYNEIINDLENNSYTSNLWTQIDNSTKNQIKNTYSNLLNCFSNSVDVLQNSDSTYSYSPSYSTSSNDNYPNYTTYEGDTNTYYTTYVLDNNSGGSSGTGSDNNSSSGGNGGAYAEANATGGNASIGDININIPTGGNSEDGSNIDGNITNDISAFEKLLSNNKGIVDLVINFFSKLDNDINLSIASFFVIIVACRIFGR